jgi:hypothetical protein
MIDYKQILKTFLENLDGLSDPNYQERVWVNGLGPECSSFKDDICDYFDYSEGILQDYKLFGLSSNQWQALNEFDKKLRIFCDTIPEIVDEKEEILLNPKWHVIQQMAKEVLRAFNYKQ